MMVMVDSLFQLTGLNMKVPSQLDRTTLRYHQTSTIIINCHCLPLPIRSPTTPFTYIKILNRANQRRIIYSSNEHPRCNTAQCLKKFPNRLLCTLANCAANRWATAGTILQSTSLNRTSVLIVCKCSLEKTIWRLILR